MKIHKIEQCSDEWFAMRKGKMTASHAQAIGSNGAGLKTYIYEILAEEYSSGENEFYTNKDIERGNELEEPARLLYEFETDQKVKQVGLIEFNEFVSCSPDGLIGKDGGIEIKCLNDVNYLKGLLTQKIDSKHLWQIQMNLYITDRKWWDYVAYNPNFKQNLVIIRVEPEKEMWEKLVAGLETGTKMLKELKSKLK